MPSLKNLLPDDRERCFDLICEAGDIRTRKDLLSWLRGGMQRFLPHEILIAVWGDFQRGVVHHDIVFASEAVVNMDADVKALTHYMQQLHARWTITQRQPFATDAHLLHQMVGGSSNGVAARFDPTIERSACIHGVSDLRERQDYLYVVVNRSSVNDDARENRLRIMVPYIDVAFRQIPTRGTRDIATAAHGEIRYVSMEAPQITITRPMQDVDFGITEREQQIMRWVEMGKTNHEIGAILSISAFTVKNHLQRIFKKLDVYNRAQAVSRFKDSYAHG